MSDFKWDDSLIKEFLSKVHITMPLDNLLEEFKKSKEVKPEYEILSFYYQTGKRNLAYKISNGYFVHDTCPIGKEEEMLKSAWSIHSVKRLSDGETFCVGDKVFIGGDNLEIKSFCVSDGIMYIETPKNNMWAFANIAKARTALFTTEDGKDIFEGDVWTSVQKSTFDILTPCYFKHTRPEKWLAFSTYEAAKEYVLNNKPCLSLNELISEIRKTCDGSYSNDFQDWDLPRKADEIINPISALVKEKLKM